MDGGSSMDASILAKLPGWGMLFSDLPDRQRDDLAGRLRRRRYARGEAVFIKGDEGNSLYIIESGRVHIKLTSEDGREVVLNSLGPGEFFGDLALFDGEPRSADAVAVEGSHLVLLERRDFLQFLSDFPSAAVTLLAVLSRRLRRPWRGDLAPRNDHPPEMIESP
jgi:CRP/FNR family cyclic AMP-dependent transcriptional regulator